jgi:hypothetical protein
MRILTLLFSLVLLISCEEVIDVDLNESEPKLVVEATMIRLLNKEGGGTEVKLSLTGPFFNDGIPAVTNAQVTISDSNNNIFPLTHVENGRYITDTNLTPEDNTDYTITIIYAGDTFTATEKIESVSPWEKNIEQDNEGGFLGDEIEVKAFFSDPVDEENYYYVQIASTKGRDRDITSDEFFNGNQIFALYSAEDLEPGDEVFFELDGVDRNFSNFMFILLQQGSEDGGGPFETQPATVRGNVVNETNPDNFPLGYFRVSERDTLMYTIQ